MEIKPAFILIGDLMIDQNYYCQSKGLSPEAPIPMVKLLKVEKKLGGAGNCLMNLISFNCPILFLPIYQEDHPDLHRPNLEIHYNYIAKDEGEIRTRFIDDKSKNHLLRVDFNCEKVEQIFKDDDRGMADDRWNLLILDWLVKYKDHKISLLLSDYNHKTIDLYKKTIQLIKRQIPDITIFTDSRRPIQQLIDLLELKPDFWLPNLKEFNISTEFDHKETRDFNTIRKESEKGISFIPINKKESTFHIDALDKNPVDVTGAGDTVLAAFSWHYIQYGNIQDAIIFANKAAALVVQQPGTYALTKQDVEVIIDIV